MNITLIKLGGSLITDKKTPYTLRPEIIDRLLTEIKEVVEEHSYEKFLIGNGAGSYAHQSAKKYDTVHGFADKSGAYGACVVHQDAVRLNSILVEKSLALGLPVFSLHPSSFIKSQDGGLSKLFPDIISQLISKNIFPFVYGDVIIDETKGSTIFSTDTLFRIIAEKLVSEHHTVRIIHVGNYEGVYDKHHVRIPVITPSSYASLQDIFEKTDDIDVTGSMKRKVEEMLRLTRLGISSHIIDGNTPDSIKKAFLGKDIGTRISPEKLS